MVKLSPTSLKILMKILLTFERYGGVFFLLMLALDAFNCYVGDGYEIVLNLILAAMNLYLLHSWARDHSFFSEFLSMAKTLPLIQEIYDHFAHKAVDIFNEQGECPPQLYGVWVNPETGKPSDIAIIDMHLVRHFFSSNESKDQLRLFIEFLLETPLPGVPLDRPADLVVHISEAWTVSRTSKNVEPYIPPSECDDRRETIIVLVHSEGNTAMGACDIHDTPKRHAEYGPLQTGGRFSGRFSLSHDGTVH